MKAPSMQENNRNGAVQAWIRGAQAGLRSLTRGEASGSSLVEMALVLPMMLLLVTGIFMFGIALNNNLVLTNAVAQGAQLVGVSRGLTTDPCATAVTAVENSATGLNASSLTFTLTVNGTPYKGTSCSGTTLTAGNYITLNVTYPASVTLYGLLPRNYTLSASTTEIVE